VYQCLRLKCVFGPQAIFRVAKRVFYEFFALTSMHAPEDTLETHPLIHIDGDELAMLMLKFHRLRGDIIAAPSSAFMSDSDGKVALQTVERHRSQIRFADFWPLIKSTPHGEGGLWRFRVEQASFALCLNPDCTAYS